jgi:hypothetical protein
MNKHGFSADDTVKRGAPRSVYGLRGRLMRRRIPWHNHIFTPANEIHS